MNLTREAGLMAQEGVRDCRGFGWGPFAVSRIELKNVVVYVAAASLPFGFEIAVNVVRHRG